SREGQTANHAAHSARTELSKSAGKPEACTRESKRAPRDARRLRQESLTGRALGRSAGRFPHLRARRRQRRASAPLAVRSSHPSFSFIASCTRIIPRRPFCQARRALPIKNARTRPPAARGLGPPRLVEAGWKCDFAAAGGSWRENFGKLTGRECTI